MGFLIINKLIANEQHGFVPRKGCVSNLLETLDFITDALSWGENVDEIMLDLSKAFDLVPHMVSSTNLRDTVLVLSFWIGLRIS